MKRIIYGMIIALFLTGCTIKISQSERASLENYESYYNIILNEQETQEDSSYYSVEATLVQIEKNIYRYDIFIDSPTLAMRDVVVMVVEDNISFDMQQEMMPSIGIFDPKVKLYPNQADADLGFYKGINLNRVIKKPQVNLRILVEFTNSTRDTSYHEVLEISLNAQK